MKCKTNRYTFSKSGVATAVLFSIFGLSACSGGTDGNPGAIAAKSGADGTAASIKVEGQSAPLSSQIENVVALVPPVSWSADGSLPKGELRLGGEGLASVLKAHAPGAYTTLPRGDGTLSLSTGTVTDIAGNGAFAIGRWTAGSDSAGHSYNVNQGQAWAVGARLRGSPSVPAAGLRCELTAATRPTASDGNTAPGVLTAATAVVVNNPDRLDPAEHAASVTLGYSIGSDRDRTFTSQIPVGALFTSSKTRSSFASGFFGPSAISPYLVISYGVHAPTVGLINGLAVLRCSK